MLHPLVGLGPRRRLLGFKAVDIAQRVGLSENGYGRIERGQRRVYFDKAIAISAFTGISLIDLTREPTEEERIELFKAGEQRRALQTRSDGDAGVAAAIEEFDALGEDDEG
jgi:transcriptional regulator with XRE-family HTH domain